MQHLEVSCTVRRFFKSLGVKGLMLSFHLLGISSGFAKQKFVCEVLFSLRNPIDFPTLRAIAELWYWRLSLLGL